MFSVEFTLSLIEGKKIVYLRFQGMILLLTEILRKLDEQLVSSLLVHLEILEVFGVRNLEEWIEELLISEFTKAIEAGELSYYLSFVLAVPEDR